MKYKTDNNNNNKIQEKDGGRKNGRAKEKSPHATISQKWHVSQRVKSEQRWLIGPPKAR